MKVHKGDLLALLTTDGADIDDLRDRANIDKTPPDDPASGGIVNVNAVNGPGDTHAQRSIEITILRGPPQVVNDEREPSRVALQGSVAKRPVDHET